jgi:hypothetical protein
MRFCTFSGPTLRAVPDLCALHWQSCSSVHLEAVEIFFFVRKAQRPNLYVQMLCLYNLLLTRGALPVFPLIRVLLQTIVNIVTLNQELASRFWSSTLDENVSNTDHILWFGPGLRCFRPKPESMLIQGSLPAFFLFFFHSRFVRASDEGISMSTAVLLLNTVKGSRDRLCEALPRPMTRTTVLVLIAHVKTANRSALSLLE